MSIALIISGFLLGIISSFHCVGMCGVFAFSLPVSPAASSHKKLLGILLYNGGRAITYGLMGLLFGAVGRRFYIAGLQQVLSIIAGIVTLLIVLLVLFNRRSIQLRIFNRWIQVLIGKALRSKSNYALLFIGLANGLLPCGMVYFALTGAVATGSIMGGFSFMLAFGVGTFPLMIAVSYFGQFLTLNTRNLVKKVTPYIMLGMSILLIVRGMNLGIPYLSPAFSNTSANAISCH